MIKTTFDLTHTVAAGGGDEEGHALWVGLFRGGISRKVKKIRPVYGHLNALQNAQIHHRPGLRPICTPGSSPHILVDK